MSGTSFEPKRPIQIEQRIQDFREQGLLQNLPEEFDGAQLLDTLLVGNGNNSDFARMYGRIEELLDQVIEDTAFLEELTGEKADNLLGMIHELRNSVKIGLEGNVDEISRFATSIPDLIEFSGNIPSAELDEIAQKVHDVAELLQLVCSTDDPECVIIQSKLNQDILYKMQRLRKHLTTIEDLARLIDIIAQELETE